MSKQAFKRIRRVLGIEVNREPLPAFAWPGGYPIVYLDGGNMPLCAACASECCGSEVLCMRPTAFFVHFEGAPEQCSECYCEIESAYGEPE